MKNYTIVIPAITVRNATMHVRMKEIFELHCNRAATETDYKEAAEIMKEYISKNGRGCVSYIAGMDTEKCDMMSMADIMGVNYG